MENQELIQRDTLLALAILISPLSYSFLQAGDYWKGLGIVGAVIVVLAVRVGLKKLGYKKVDKKVDK